MGTFLNLTLSGVSLAALLFLVAAGLSLVFGLMGVLNFAHGAFFLWGAYVWYAIYVPTGNFWIALLAAFVLGAGLGAVTERVFIRTLYQRPLAQILVTLGLGLVLTQLVVAIWDSDQIPKYPTAPPGLSGTFQAGDISVTQYQLFGIVVGFVVLAAVWLLLRFTRVGLIVRAGVENPTMVRALGINVSTVFMGVFSLGSALAALGGAIYGPWQSDIDPAMGQNILLTAIIVVVIGGLGSYLGSAVGALLIGLAQEYVPYYAGQLAIAHPAFQTWVSSAESLISLILLIVILLIRPSGLLGVKHHVGGAL
ncbi:MAG TPA: branched-chain amino acid ABC transporter permease [Chloroflexota bacterium]|jgi:branched-chain amino acid transport system permease protein|nr:branched-chain amino acid ABC transporter permease [Chloroflexota bacterium]